MSDQPKKSDLLGWLDPESKDFMGSGMEMGEWLLANGIQRYKNSWANQNRKEIKRRMHFLFEMVLEGRRIQEAHGQCIEGEWFVQSGMLINMGIEAVITGDLRDLDMTIQMSGESGLVDNYGEEAGKRVAAMYTKFNELLTQARDTWPDEDKAQA